MIDPTDKFVVEFLDFRHRAIPNTATVCDTEVEARARAESVSIILGTSHWRILKVIANSCDLP